MEKPEQRHMPLLRWTFWISSAPRGRFAFPAGRRTRVPRGAEAHAPPPSGGADSVKARQICLTS